MIVLIPPERFQGEGQDLLLSWKSEAMSAMEGPENKGAINFAVVYTILIMIFILGLVIFG